MTNDSQTTAPREAKEAGSMVLAPRPTASAWILARLGADPAIAAILPPDAKIVGAGRGGGGWSWVIEGEDYKIGSECPRSRFLGATGISASLVSFDQIECDPHPGSGVFLDFRLEMELARHAKRKKAALTDRQQQILGRHG